ncbi:uncharacterized protein LOC141684888 [Apium graveolens]|uniref:uncharacterized protein LOC141684888 n=1 Tax=Apium graveolens TaxID=4045 RepID=UPI003D7B7C35
MILVGWNYRGVGQPRTVRVLKDVIRSQKPDLLFLSETLAVRNKIEALASKLGFTNFFSVDRVGRSGGLVIFWKHNMSCAVMSSSQNHIDLEVKEGRNLCWKLTCFYGFPERERRQESWDFIRSLASSSQLPWCIFGDFNDMLYLEDKKGKHLHPQRLLNGFKSAIEDCNLSELELKGGNFTWEKSKGTSDWVREKLDKAFATDSWWHMFPLCTLSVSHTIVSDHDPINIELVNTVISKKQFRFKFENTWLKEAKFQTKVAEFWKSLPAVHLLPKLISISSFMAEWGRTFFHKFREKVSKQKEIIEGLKDREDDDGIHLYFEEKEKLDFEEEIKVMDAQNDMLTANLTFKEFTEAVRSMHPDKASGSDGLNRAFFQYFWKLVGREVYQCCQQWLEEYNVEECKDLRPIALCNILYKIVVKVLANRFQQILHVLILDEQSVFVPGRNITDNVLVAFEVLRHMKRKNSGQEGEVALKLDISKAYD